ncbi:MAG: ABC transporter substrate-binding protein [Coriobacteriia bacterium]|nr:ABC transporter substrate-binding protein [Coriobacteriia bacterium]
MKQKLKHPLSVFLTGVLALSLLNACSTKDNEQAGDEEVAIPNESSELDIKYAEYFTIVYLADGVKLVTDADDRELLLVPNDVPIPNGYGDKILVRTPIEHAFFSSTTHVGLMGSLDVDSLYDSIAAVSTEESSWTTPQVLERFANGQIKYIAGGTIDVPDAEIVLGLGLDIYFSIAYPGLGRLSQYEEVGITYAAVGEWMEKSNPAYMEWIKFFAAFYNLDELADQVFEAKMQRMAELSALVQDIPDDQRPVVAYVQVYNGSVHTQSSDSTTAKEIYNAGANYYLEDLGGEGNPQISMEEFFDKARDADILVYYGLIDYTPDKAALLEVDPLFGELKSFQNDQVYIFASDYYMNSAAKDTLFEDMMTIFHPDLMPDHELRLIIKLPD